MVAVYEGKYFQQYKDVFQLKIYFQQPYPGKPCGSGKSIVYLCWENYKYLISL